MVIIGMIFGVLVSLVFVGLGLYLFTLDDIELIMKAMFLGIGSVSCFSFSYGLFKCFQILRRKSAIVEQGRKLGCFTIAAYKDDFSIIVNGMPGLIIVCQDEDGKVYEFNTGTTDEAQYPLDSYIDLYELDGEVAYDKNSIKIRGDL